MAKYLEWYLVELEKGLEGKLSAEATFELLNQTEDHLSMIKQELVAAGMDEATAEQAAIQRFGDLEALAGKPRAKQIVRANWAAPALMLVAGTVLTGASMIVGSNDSMIMASVFGIACLVVSALLCCRRGKLPSLAFGVLLASCFTSLAIIASIEFYGPNLDLVKRTDRAKFVAEVQHQRLRTIAESKVKRAGLAWARSDDIEPVPTALKTASGILAPVVGKYGQVRFRMDATAPWRNDGLGHLFGIGGRRYYNRSSAVLFTRSTPDITDAHARWASLTDRVMDPEHEIEQLDGAIAALSSSHVWDSDNLFAGICFGALLSTIWMLIATLLNMLANVKWPVGQADKAHVRAREYA